MPGRKTPASLTTVLTLAPDLEATATGTHRQRAAIAAMSALLLAVHDAGWQQVELARHLGMKLATVHKRIQNARAAHPDGVAIVVDAPVDRPPSRLAVLQQPVGEREWLTIGEAADRGKRQIYPDFDWLLEQIASATV